MGADEPTIEPIREADIEVAASLEELAALCTVRLWLPQPWPAHLAPAALTFSRWSPEEVTYNVSSDRRLRPMGLLVSGKAPVANSFPGTHFRSVPGLPWNAQIADDSQEEFGAFDRCWGWMEPPGVQLMLRGDRIAVEELIEIMGTVALIEPR